jgi:hypothetical protein
VYNIRRVFLPTVHSYGGDASVIFIALNSELREICRMILWYYDIMVLWYLNIYSLGKLDVNPYNIRRVFLPTVHSYGGDASVIFISLKSELREICRMILWYYGVMVLWYYGIMVLWYYGIMVLWCYGIMVLWCYGIMVLWYYGVMVLWYYGIMVLWYYDVMVLVFEYIFSRIATGEASAASVYNIRRVFLPTVHSYGGDASVIFISLNYELREICIMVLWYYDNMML